MIESKVVNIERVPGKIVPTVVNKRDNPEYFVIEETVEVVEAVKPKKAPAKKKAAAKKKKTVTKK